MHKITPLQLRILLDLHTSPTPPDLPTPTHIEQFKILQDDEMIWPSIGCEWLLSKKGEAYIDHILSTPFPEKRYVVVRDDQEAE